MTRKTQIERKTNETDISIKMDLDSPLRCSIDSGIPFFDHMLNSMFRHGGIWIDVKCQGDTEIDYHHSIEDIGICLGQAMNEALGDKAGIVRFGHASVPMDEALSEVSIDISGRAFFKYTGKELDGHIRDYDEELTLEFFQAFTVNCGINLHIIQQYGKNRHHIHESIFKSVGRALREAIRIDPNLAGEIPSTKGSL